MPKKLDVFKGSMGDWEPVEPPSQKKFDSGERPLSKPNRVARERKVLVDKYLSDASGVATEAAEGSNKDHATLVRAKKKGTLDNEVNAKTFVVSGNKIVGSQG
jgi:hypothetical protein